MATDAGMNPVAGADQPSELGSWVNDWPVAQDSIYGFLGLNWSGESAHNGS